MIQLWHNTEPGRDFVRHPEDFETPVQALLALAMLAALRPGDFQISDARGSILELRVDELGAITSLTRGSVLRQLKRHLPGQRGRLTIPDSSVL